MIRITRLPHKPPSEDYYSLHVEDQPPRPEENHKDDEPRGLLLMVASLVLFSTTMLLNRVILQALPIDAVNLFMYSSAVQVLVSEALRRGVYREQMDHFLSNRRAVGLIVVRQLFSVAGWLALTYLSSQLPIGYIQLNQNAIPIVTAAIGFFFLNEVVSRLETIALFVCFSVISATGAYKVYQSEDSHGNYSLTNILLCLLSVATFSAINVIGRLLKGFHFSVLCTAQFVLNVAFSLVIAVFVCESLFIPRDLYSLALVVALGLSRTFSTLLFVKACQLAKSQRLATLNYAQSLFGYSIDVFIYKYSLTWVELVAVVTVLGTGAITFIQTHREHAETKDSLKQPLLEPATSK